MTRCSSKDKTFVTTTSLVIITEVKTLTGRTIIIFVDKDNLSNEVKLR